MEQWQFQDTPDRHSPWEMQRIRHSRDTNDTRRQWIDWAAMNMAGADGHDTKKSIPNPLHCMIETNRALQSSQALGMNGVVENAYVAMWCVENGWRIHVCEVIRWCQCCWSLHHISYRRKNTNDDNDNLKKKRNASSMIRFRNAHTHEPHDIFSFLIEWLMRQSFWLGEWDKGSL